MRVIMGVDGYWGIDMRSEKVRGEGCILGWLRRNRERCRWEELIVVIEDLEL